jgi:hypothetical protein
MTKVAPKDFLLRASAVPLFIPEPTSLGFRLGEVQPTPIDSLMSTERRQIVMSDATNRKHLKIWKPATYRIEVDGYVDASWSDCLGGMRITTTSKREDESVVTTLVGRVRDQAELSGVLNSLYEMHLAILSVELVDEE